MLKKQKELKISSFQIIILSVISIIISIGGFIVFSFAKEDTPLNIFIITFLVVLSTCNMFFVIAVLLRLFEKWLCLRKSGINIFRTKYDSTSHTFEVIMCSGIISIILLVLIIILILF